MPAHHESSAIRLAHASCGAMFLKEAEVKHRRERSRRIRCELEMVLRSDGERNGG